MKKPLTTFGYILERLDVQTVSMARALHVDASLISKWKNGDRVLSTKSIYFDDVIDFLLQKSTETMHEKLQEALLALYPSIIFQDETQIEHYLRQAISSKKNLPVASTSSILTGHFSSVSALVFEKNQGRRDAIDQILKFAEKMDTSGSLLFIDNEEFTWLLENPDYAFSFNRRIEELIHKGFHVTFVLHYSARHADFSAFFNLCSPLIFHRNTDWYCNSYYDDTILRFSIATLNDAISMLGLSSDHTTSSTTIFEDQSIVLMHKVMAEQIIERAKPLFVSYSNSNSLQLLKEVSLHRQVGTIYSCLPSPVFLLCRSSLLHEILKDNHMDENTINRCLSLNNAIRKFSSGYFTKDNRNFNQPFYFIFRLEDFIKRAKQTETRSRSLTLACGSKIYVKRHFFAKQLRNYAQVLQEYPNIHMIFVSEKDKELLPPVNCWCKQNVWLVQMNKAGFRISEEYNVVSSATIKWERCIRSVPMERKDNACVSRFLLDLANSMDE